MNNHPTALPGAPQKPVVMLSDGTEYFQRQDLVETIRKVKEALTRPGTGRRVALYGMGGAGKTTVARQIAFELAGEFAGGIFWADLADANNDVDQVLNLWGELCDVDLSGKSTDARRERVRQLLSQRQGRVLVVVDNIYPASVEPLKKTLFPALPAGTAMLLLCRGQGVAVSLNLTGDHIHAIRSLPAGEALPFFKACLGVPGIFEHASLQSVEKLLASTGCLPLAVKLAARCLLNEMGWLAELPASGPSPSEVDEFDQRVVRLRRKIERGASEEMKDENDSSGLWGTFNASFKAFRDGHGLKTLFYWLGIFSSSPIRWVDIACVTGIYEGTLEKGLLALERAGLIENNRGRQAHLHPLLHQYGREKLNQEDAARLHSTAYAYFLAQASAFSPAKNLELLLKAHYHAIQAGRIDLAAGILLEHDLPDRLIRLGLKGRLIALSRQTFGRAAVESSYADYLRKEGYTGLDSPPGDPGPCARRCRRLGKCAEFVPAYQRALECYQRSAGLLGDSDSRELIRLQRDTAVIYARLEDANRLDEGLRLCREGLEKLAACSDADKDFDAAELHGSAGMILEQQQKPAEAQAHFEQAHRLYKQLNLETRAYEMYDNLGIMLQNQAELFQPESDQCRALLTQAERYHHEALDYFSSPVVNDPFLTAWAGLNLGACLYRLDQLEPAAKCYKTALESMEDIGDRKGIALCCMNLGEIEWKMGQLDSAEKLLRRGHKISVDNGDAGDEAFAGQLLYVVCKALGKDGEAQEFAGYCETDDAGG